MIPVLVFRDIYPSNPYWFLHGVDGDSILNTADFDEFCLANPEHALDVIHLMPGETFRAGGGASPEWSITRLS